MCRPLFILTPFSTFCSIIFPPCYLNGCLTIANMKQISAGNLVLHKVQDECFRQQYDLKDIEYLRWHNVSKDAACVMIDEFLQFENCRNLIKHSNYEFGTKVLLAMVLARSTNNIRARQLRYKRAVRAKGGKSDEKGENSGEPA